MTIIMTCLIQYLRILEFSRGADAAVVAIETDRHGAHDLDAHDDNPLRVEHVGHHDGAVLGEGVGRMVSRDMICIRSRSPFCSVVWR